MSANLQLSWRASDIKGKGKVIAQTLRIKR